MSFQTCLSLFYHLRVFSVCFSRYQAIWRTKLWINISAENVESSWGWSWIVIAQLVRNLRFSIRKFESNFWPGFALFVKNRNSIYITTTTRTHQNNLFYWQSHPLIFTIYGGFKPSAPFLDIAHGIDYWNVQFFIGKDDAKWTQRTRKVQYYPN